MPYPELSRIFYQKARETLAQKGFWKDFIDHYQIWKNIKRQEALGVNPIYDGSEEIEEPDPDDYPLLDD